MALDKKTVAVNFSQGLDLKTDPKQVTLGKFLRLENSVFDTGGLLGKRNGFGALTSLPDSSNTFLTTFNGNLTAIGTELYAYAAGPETWIQKGNISPVSLETLPLIRSNVNQTQSDTAVSPNGLVCIAYSEVNNGTTTYKYAIEDATTGQNIVSPQAIPVGSNTVEGAPKVFTVGNYFVLVFSTLVSATHHLQYFAINYNTLATVSATDISTTYTPAATGAFDGVVTNNTLYLAWNGSDVGGAIRLCYLSSTLSQSNTVSFTGKTATLMSVTADISGSTPVIYASFYNSGSSTGYTLAVSQILSTILAPTETISSGTITNITSAAENGVATVFYETLNSYGYDTGVLSNYISSLTVTVGGTVGSPSVVLRSVGLASKAFILSGTIYFLSVYSSPYQPTYFLSNASGNIVSRLAYSNGGGYLGTGLPNVSVTGTLAQVSYLYKDLLQSQAPSGAQSIGLQPGNVYSQTGINLVSFTIQASYLSTAEIGGNLNLSGGFFWMYDGYLPVEQNFFLWPDSIEGTWSTSGGSMHAQPDGSTNTDAYYYQVVYEWSDNQGNIFRSAPSIPLAVTTTGSGTSGSVVLHGPNLRLTYKTANPVKIVIYRWSVAQQNYYQVTSITAPLLNSTTADAWSFTDTLADSSISGNNLIYTTGGVVEDIGAPATKAMTIFDDRVWLIDSEDENLLWYSKQVIEGTPVEMSDLFTYYVAPSTASEGSTGPSKTLFPMDDKLIIGKANALYYINGTGPDNTGAKSNYPASPIFITSTVGSKNQASIVFIPQGLMFESNKGIWLLGRDLSTSFIGAPVQSLTTGATVLSAVNIPGTNQVRFTLDSGVTLMFDYYYGQWGTFTNVPAISSTIYDDLHTFITASGQVYQETPGSYLDGSNPVLMAFQTSWIQPLGLQGYQRAYECFFLGTYLTPHKLNFQIAYDYASAPLQQLLITPQNYTAPWGGQNASGNPPWGSESAWGGGGNLEDWEIKFARQRCRAFQISFQEVFDPSFGTVAGPGLTLSGLNLVVGLKKGYRPVPAARIQG